MKRFEIFIFLVLFIFCAYLDNPVEGAHVLKAIDPFITGSLIVGGGSLLGSLFGSIFGSSSSSKQANAMIESQRETNKTNERIAGDTNANNRELVRMQNETNLALAREQNQWNLEQWNRQNQYNSPQNQVELYKAAGLNPATLAGQFSPAQPLESANLANQQSSRDVAPQIEDPMKAAAPFMRDKIAYIQQIGTAMKDFSNGLVDMRKADSEIKRNEVLNMHTEKQIEQMTKNIELWSKNIEYLNLKMIHEDTKYLEEVIKLKSEVSYIRSLTDLNGAEKNYKVQLTKNAGVQEALSNVELKIDEITLDSWREMTTKQIAVLAASAQQYLSVSDLNRQEFGYRDSHSGFSPSDVMSENLLDTKLRHDFTQGLLDRRSRERIAGWNNNTQILTHLMDNNTKLFSSRDFNVAKLVFADIVNMGLQYGYTTGPFDQRKGFVKAAVDTRKAMDNKKLLPAYKGFRNKKAFMGNVKY